MLPDQTKFMCLNQDGTISLLVGKPLKLLDQFIYICCNISSTESNVNIYIDKASTSINRLMEIWYLR